MPSDPVAICVTPGLSRNVFYHNGSRVGDSTETDPKHCVHKVEIYILFRANAAR